MVCVPGASALGGTLNIYIGDKLGKIHQLDYHPASGSVRDDLLCDSDVDELDMDWNRDEVKRSYRKNLTWKKVIATMLF